MADLDLDIFALTETKLRKKEKKEIKGYKSKVVNSNSAAGGIAVYIKENIKTKSIKVHEECQTRWLHVEGERGENLALGVTYSPCEGITKSDDISKIIEEHKTTVKTIQASGYEQILWVGDFNAHVGADKEGIEGNNDHIGKNGIEYRKLLKETNLKLAHNKSCCQGKWTRVQKDKKAILDLTIASEESLDRIKEMKIDEEKLHAISSEKAPTDHNLTYIEYDMKPKWKSSKSEIEILDKNELPTICERLQTQMQGKEKEKITQDELNQILTKISKDITKKRKVKQTKIHTISIMDEELKEEIKIRRKICAEWRKEQNIVIKETLHQQYHQQKTKVKEMIDRKLRMQSEN